MATTTTTPHWHEDQSVLFFQLLFHLTLVFPPKFSVTDNAAVYPSFFPVARPFDLQFVDVEVHHSEDISQVGRYFQYFPFCPVPPWGRGEIGNMENLQEKKKNTRNKRTDAIHPSVRTENQTWQNIQVQVDLSRLRWEFLYLDTGKNWTVTTLHPYGSVYFKTRYYT